MTLALAVAACGAPATPPHRDPPSRAAAAGFGGTDRAWLELTVAMDEQLLPLLGLAPGRSASTALKDVSEQVRAFTEEELATLRQLGGEAGLPAVNQHEGMPMPGMVSPSTVTTAAGRRGAAFDDLLARSLRDHLEQSRKLALSERSAGVESRTKALAERIVQTRAAALEALHKDF